MAKKLLSEAQVRKFMGLANLDANLSSNFLNEMYGDPAKRDDEEKMEEEKHDDEKEVMKEEEDEMDEGYKMKRDDEPMEEEMEMDMDADAEGGDIDGDADVELDEEEVQEAKSAMDKIQAVLDKLMGGAGAEPEMDDMPADEPEMDMDAEMDMDDEEEMMQEVELQLSEDEIVQEVARRVAKRINEAARAQKKADRLLGRKK